MDRDMRQLSMYGMTMDQTIDRLQEELRKAYDENEKLLSQIGDLQKDLRMAVDNVHYLENTINRVREASMEWLQENQRSQY